MHATSLYTPELGKTTTELVVVLLPATSLDHDTSFLLSIVVDISCDRTPDWLILAPSSSKRHQKLLASLRRISVRRFDSILDVLLYSQNVPTIIYDADQSEEHVWTELVSAMQDWFRAGLLFLYQNLEREQILASIMDAGNDGDISQVVGQQRSLSCKGLSDGWGWRWVLRCLHRLVQRVLADISSPDILRRGKLDVKVDSTIEHAFGIATDRGFSISDGVYALRSIVLPRKWLSRLLEKRKGPGETFMKVMKVSVFRMANEQE